MVLPNPAMTAGGPTSRSNGEEDDPTSLSVPPSVMTLPGMGIDPSYNQHALARNPFLPHLQSPPLHSSAPEVLRYHHAALAGLPYLQQLQLLAAPSPQLPALPSLSSTMQSLAPYYGRQLLNIGGIGVDPLSLGVLQPQGNPYSSSFASLPPGLGFDTSLHLNTGEFIADPIVRASLALDPPLQVNTRETVAEPIVTQTSDSPSNTRDVIITEPIVVRMGAGSGGTTIGGNRRKRKTPDDSAPVRPLSAYNYFFSDERDRILREVEDEDPDGGDADAKPRDDAESRESRKRRLINRHINREPCKKRPHRSSHGKISFVELSRMIGKRWRALPDEEKEDYRDIAATDMRRYQSQMAASHRQSNEHFGPRAASR